MGPKKKTVTVTEALTRNLAPLLEMKVNQDGIPTALEPEDILSFLHEMEQYNAQRTDVMERALILLCMSGDVRDYLAQYESLLTINHTENDEVQEWELLSYDRWDPNKKTERQKCLDWDETIADALRKEFGLVRHGNESFKEALERKLMKTFEPTGNGPKHDFSVLAVQVAAVVKSAMQKSMEELTEEEQKHVSKCLREMFVNHPLMRAKLKNLPKDSFPEHPGKLLMKLGEMGKQFWDGSALFADYALLLKPVQDALEDKDRQIKYWRDKAVDKAVKKDQPKDKATNDHEAGPSGHDKDKKPAHEWREGRKINPSIKCHNCGETGHIASNCTGKRTPRQGTMPPPPPRTTATTAASSVSAVSGGSSVDTSNLSPESRGMVENVARSLARK